MGSRGFGLFGLWLALALSSVLDCMLKVYSKVDFFSRRLGGDGSFEGVS